MSDSDTPGDHAFQTRLADRLTELRLGIDLGEITSPAAFVSRLQRDGGFTADDPRVRAACALAGLTPWLGAQREAQ